MKSSSPKPAKVSRLRGVHYQKGHSFLSAVLPGDWPVLMKERLRLKYLEDPEKRRKRIKKRTERGIPKRGDLVLTLGAVERDPRHIQSPTFRPHSFLKDIPYRYVKRLHRIFGNSPQTIDFRKFEGAGAEKEAAILRAFQFLGKKGIEFRSVSPPNDVLRYADKKLVCIRARIKRAPDDSRPELYDLEYEETPDGAHMLVSVSESYHPKIYYTSDYYALFEHAGQNALKDIGVQRKKRKK